MNVKIAVIGPESTGKTALCKQLADHYNAIWIPELAREYIENKNFIYTYEDVEEIAKLQIDQVEKLECAEEVNLCFFDTDLIITKVWFEHKYQNTPEFVLEHLAKRPIHFYLLCEPDLPWEFDPVRENGDNRDFFFDWYKEEIQNIAIPYAAVYGKGSERTQNAIKKVDEFLLKIKNEQSLKTKY